MTVPGAASPLPPPAAAEDLDFLADLPAPVPDGPLAPASDAPSAGEATPPDPVGGVGEVSASFDGWGESIVGGTVETVMANTGTLAHGAQANALNLLGQLATYAASFTPLPGALIPTLTVTIPDLGSAPTEPSLVATFPSAPDAPSLPSLPALSVGEPPDYSVGDIDIQDIPLPNPLDALLPSAPQLDALGNPAEPDFTLPAVPTLLDLALPDAPLLELPMFTATLGAKPEAPTVEFAYAEAEYGTALLTAAQNRILALLAEDAGSGIGQAVEDAIWERAAAREAMLTHRATGEAVRMMQCRGFRMPEASMVRVIQQALQGGLNRSAGLQRDIIIEQARLQQANFRFAFETAVSLEATMMDKHNAVQARALEAAKAMVQSEMSIFNARVALFSADVQAFAVQTQVFKARLDAALAAIEVYRTQLEAQKVIGEINSQRVAVYKAQIGGVRAIVEIYKSRVDAAKAQIANNKAIVESYRATVSAIEAQVAAKIAEYDTYAAQVRGQAVKAELYGKQVEAYRARVGAFGELAQARIGVQQLQFKQANEFPLELYKSRLDAYKAGVGASVEQLRAIVSVYQSRVGAFSAQEGAKAGHVQAQLKVAAANLEGTLAQAEALIDVGRANLQVASGAAQTAQGNIRTIGQLAGQMAAAAVAAQSVHATISENASESTSFSVNTAANETNSQTATASTGSSANTNTSYASHTTTSNSVASTSNTGKSFRSGTSNTSSTHRSIDNNTRRSSSYGHSKTWSSDVSNSVSTECDDITTHNDK
jgi:hypothetical protein